MLYLVEADTSAAFLLKPNPNLAGEGREEGKELTFVECRRPL